MAKLSSFRDLRVYQELKKLYLDVHEISMTFPKFELYELGSQIRRSSNSAPANLAEGWGSRHTNIYLESLNRAMGETRETQHHLSIARDKSYITRERFDQLDDRYDHCGRMLERLHQALSEWKGTTRTGNVVRERTVPYRVDGSDPIWAEVSEIMETVVSDFSDEHLTPNTEHQYTYRQQES